MKKIILAALTIFLLNTTSVLAADKMGFDSTDKYLGACQLTDKSLWELKSEIPVTTFQIWYSWNANEATLPVKIFLNGEKFAEFEATRSSCDPYQKQWCNADFAINKTFPKGVYTTEIPNKRQCLKPGGTGTVRLYQTDSSVTVVSPTPTPTSTPSPTPIYSLTPTVVPIVATQTAKCECNQTVIIVTAVAASSLVSFLISFLFRIKKS